MTNPCHPGAGGGRNSDLHHPRPDRTCQPNRSPMSKDEIKTAIAKAVAEHQLNNQASSEAAVPEALKGVLSKALAGALEAKLLRIFDPQP